MSLTSSPGSLTEGGSQASWEDRLRLLESAERLADLGGWEWFPRSSRLLWSANLYRIFGVEPEEITPSLEFVLRRTHPGDRDRVATQIELTRSEPCPPPIEYRIDSPGRGVRYLRSTTMATRWDDRGPSRIAGVVQDITDHRLDSRELAAHLAVSRALAAWEVFEVSGPRLLGDVAEALDFVFAALWLPNSGLLKSRLQWSNPSLDASAFAAATRTLSFPRGVGFLGRAWERKTPVNVVDVLAEPDYRPREPAALAGLRGAAAFPVLHAGEVLAVLELYKQEEYQPACRANQTMIAISNELGRFLARRQGQLLDFSPLTPREVQVLQLAADGFSRSQIASRLTVTSATIATHMKHIFESLGVRDRAAAVATAIRLGLIA